jgi:hypothetical protein
MMVFLQMPMNTRHLAVPITQYRQRHLQQNYRQIVPFATIIPQI